MPRWRDKLPRPTLYSSCEDREAVRQATQTGTRWVAPGEGSTWRELANAFGSTDPRLTGHLQGSIRTNLLLTGLSLTDCDRQRWESGNVH